MSVDLEKEQESAIEPIPPDAPVVTQRVIVDVLSDNSIKVQSVPQLSHWALVGLFSTLIKNLGG